MTRLNRFLPLLGLIFLVLALWLAKRELQGFSLADVGAYLHELPAWRIAVALGLTALNYAVLTGYDALALRYVRQSLPYRKSALASFIGYAFSIALGHVVLTGGAVRYRLYTAWGLPAEAIAKVIAFCGLAFWVGFLSLGGLVFLVDPLPTPDVPISPRVRGGVFVGVFGAWLILNAVRERPLKVWRWTVDLPGGKTTMEQAVVASVDLALAAAVLWMLLPPDMPLHFTHVLSAFLLALIAGVVSAVPGGLGVFDGLLVALLAPTVPAPTVLGALVAYRALYYLLPFALAALTLAGTELTRRREARPL